MLSRYSRRIRLINCSNIGSRAASMCLANVKLICHASPLQLVKGNAVEMLRLNHKHVEFGGPVTGSCQLPSHGFFGFGTHVKIEPQMGHAVFCKMQIESKAGRTDLSFHIEALELCYCGFPEVAMDVGGTDTRSFSSIKKGSLLSHQFALYFWISHDVNELLKFMVFSLASGVSKM